MKTVRPAGPRVLGTVALATMLAAAACGDRRPRTAQLEFAPGLHVARHDDLRVELVQASYDDMGVTLRIDLDNRGKQPITIERAGLLLALDDLEYPVASDPAPTLAPRIELAPEQSLQVQARFSFGHKLESAAMLRMRAVQRDGRWIENVQLEVPPGFVDEKGG